MQAPHPDSKNGGALAGSPGLHSQSRGVRPGRRLRPPMEFRYDEWPRRGPDDAPGNRTSGRAALALVEAVKHLQADFGLLCLLLGRLTLLGSGIACGAGSLNAAKAEAAEMHAE